MKKIIKSLSIFMIVLIALFNIACFSSDDDLDIINGPTMSVEYTEYLGYSAEIHGTLKNNSSRSYDYVSIEFSVYDSNGNNLGTAIDNVNNIGAGESWVFSATLFSFPSSRPTSYKLIEITAW